MVKSCNNNITEKFRSNDSLRLFDSIQEVKKRNNLI